MYKTSDTTSATQLYKTSYETSANIKQIAIKHEDMIKSNQLTDNLDKIRGRVDNIISKSKIISKKEKINQA